MSPDFDRGAWFAFDYVLGYLNTKTEQTLDKKVLYKEILDMRPKAIKDYHVD